MADRHLRRRVHAGRADVDETTGHIHGLTGGFRRKQALRDALEPNRTIREAMKDGNASQQDLVDQPRRIWRTSACKNGWRKGSQAHGMGIRAVGQTNALLERAGAVSRRDTAAGETHAVAKAALGIAAEGAEGHIDGLEDDRKPKSGMPGRARSVFCKTIARLRKSAQTEVREASADAFDQIRAADDTIAAIDKRISTDAQARKHERINPMSVELGVAADQQGRPIATAIAATFAWILAFALRATARETRCHSSCPAHLLVNALAASGYVARAPRNPPIPGPTADSRG